MAMGTRQSEQASMWVATVKLPKSPGHPFYTRLNALLDAADFDPLGVKRFDIAERERVAKIPAHGTQNQPRRRLPPLEDCRSGCVLHDLFSLPATRAKVATHPFDSF